MSDNKDKHTDKILFTCSGCSDAGFLAHRLGLHLHYEGYAEMSCLAGFSAGKKKFLKKIENKEIVVIDGCKTACAKEIFKQRKIAIDKYISLQNHGISKTEDVKKLDNEKEIEPILKKLKR
jgi:uncharacterized metal-binding protein